MHVVMGRSAIIATLIATAVLIAGLAIVLAMHWPWYVSSALLDAWIIALAVIARREFRHPR